MTLREMAAARKPFAVDEKEDGGVHGCPYYWGFEEEKTTEAACRIAHRAWFSLLDGNFEEATKEACQTCWDREARHGTEGKGKT